MAISKKLPRNESVRILYLVGGADSMKDDDQKKLLDLLRKATGPLTNKGPTCRPEFVFSGGTDSGISSVAKDFGEEIDVPVHGWLPSGAQLADKVVPHWDKTSDRFSIDQPLAMWQEIEDRRLGHPKSLAVVATSGGGIANAELAVAAACGVPIALLPFGNPEESEAAVSLFRPERRQLALPADAMVLRAFLLRSWGLMKVAPTDPESTSIDSGLGRAAVAVHEDYRAKQSARREDSEPAEESWKKLKKDHKRSNLDQAAGHFWYLEEAGIPVYGDEIDKEAARKTQDRLEERPTLVRRLAKLEHGRWTIERFEQGVRRGPRPYRGDSPDNTSVWDKTKAFFAELYDNVVHSGKNNMERDKEEKEPKDITHSDVVAWRDLPEEVKVQDVDAIEGIPGVHEESLRRVKEPSS